MAGFFNLDEANLPEYRKSVGLPEKIEMPMEEQVGPPAPAPAGTVSLAEPKLPPYQPTPLLGQKPAPAPTPTVTPQQIQAVNQMANLAQPSPGMLPVQKIVEEDKQLSPGFLTKQQIAFDKENEAIQAQADLATQRARSEENVLKIRDFELRKQLEEQEKARATQQMQLDAKVNEWNGAVREYNEAKIDPDRRNVGQRILGAIAVGLGAFGAGLTGGPNYAMQIIESQIDRDIKAQEADLAKKKTAVDLSQNAVAFFRQKGFDLQQSQLAAKSALLEQSQREMQQVAARYRSPEIQAKLQEMTAAAQSKQLGLTEQLKLSLQNPDRTVMQRPPSGAPSVGDMKDMQTIANNSEEIKQYKAARSAEDRFVALREAGADGAAMMDFIASGMKQGSFTPTFIDMLKKRGILDKAGEVVRSTFEGGVDPKLMDDLQNGLSKMTSQSLMRADGAIKQLKAMGLPSSLVAGDDTTRDAVKRLGGVRQ